MAEATSVLRRFEVARWLYSTHWHTAGELGHGDILGSRKQPNKYFRIMDVRSTLDNWTYSDRKAQQTRPLHKKPNLHWNGMEDPKDGGERSVIQRPKKSKLSGWQLSTRKNFPDEVRKLFSQQKKYA